MFVHAAVFGWQTPHCLVSRLFPRLLPSFMTEWQQWHTEAILLRPRRHREQSHIIQTLVDPLLSCLLLPPSFPPQSQTTVWGGMGTRQHCLWLISPNQSCGGGQSSANICPTSFLNRHEYSEPGCDGAREHCWGWSWRQRCHRQLWDHPTTGCPH